MPGCGVGSVGGAGWRGCWGVPRVVLVLGGAWVPGVARVLPRRGVGA